MPGVDTSGAEVTHISAHGFWVLLGDEELAVPYSEFPWFKKATVEQIIAVERPTDNRLHGKGFILDPVSKAKSVALTQEGLAESKRLFNELFGKS